MENIITVEDEDTRVKDLLHEAKERYQQAEAYWAKHQQKTTETLKFIAGEQWTSNAREAFENNGYAAITDNVIPAFLRQITNELRKRTPVIEYNPLADTGTDAAEVMTDLVRNIQMESQADIAYDTAGWMAGATGIGYWRVGSEYESDTSFDQKIVILPIEDANSVLLDPAHRSVTGSDCDWAFIRTAMSKATYKRKYQGSELAELDKDPTGWQTAKGVFLDKDLVIVCEYYKKDWQERTLFRTFNKMTGETKDSFDTPDEIGVAEGVILVLLTRQVMVPVICHYVINQIEILAETTWPGTLLPLVAVKGDELWVNDERRLIGAVEPAIDSQVMLNYFLSLQAQLIQMAPKAPYIGTAKQFKDFEQQWADINVSNQAFLPYNKDDSAPPPSRDLGEVPIQNMAGLCNQARDNLKQIFGVYDASLGANGNETSGKAILARQEQTYNSNFHFYDNLCRSLTHTGQVLLEAIPTFYDSERTIQTVAVDGTKKITPVNGEGQINLNTGKFAVSIQTGPSFGTKRQEAVESMLELGRAYPNAMPLIADLVANNCDWPGAKEIALRLRAAVPPEIIAATAQTDEDPEVLVPQLQRQLQEQGKAMEALNAHAQAVEHELQLTQETLKLEKMDKEVDLRKADQTYEVKMRELQLSEEQTALEAELEIAKLHLEERKMVIQEKQLVLNATIAASDVVATAHDREVKHIDRMQNIPMPDIDDHAKLGGDLTYGVV